MITKRKIQELTGGMVEQIGSKQLFKVTTHRITIFLSYTTAIGILDTGIVYITKEYYSRTTTTHLNELRKMYCDVRLATNKVQKQIDRYNEYGYKV